MLFRKITKHRNLVELIQANKNVLHFYQTDSMAPPAEGNTQDISNLEHIQMRVRTF